MQLLKEVAPHVRRVAILYNPTFPATVLILKEAPVAASTLALGLTIPQSILVRADEIIQ